jgi:predicted dehydrogenase
MEFLMYRGVLIGAGGFGAAWAHRFLPHFRERLQIVAIADIDSETLHRAGTSLSVPDEHRYASYERMLEEMSADVCFIVIPPSLRTGAVKAAADRGMAVLCEKPIAASWQQALEIGEITRAAGITFAIMQNYREQSRIRALKLVLQRPTLQNINLVESRFGVNYTIDTAGGAFRHQIPDAFIYEGAEHHLDQLRNLIGAEAEWVSGAQWGQPWSTFAGNTCVSLLIRMTNDVMVTYEMNHVERGPQNGWHREYYRISTEGGTVTLDADDVIRITRQSAEGEQVEEVHPVEDTFDEHFAIIGQFLDWMDGGAPPFCVFEDNIKTMALTFAAIEATHTGNRVNVQAMLDQAFRDSR